MISTDLVRRITWRDAIVLALVAALVIVPALALAFAPKPSRFGFQMYSGYGFPDATYRDAANVEHEVDLKPLVIAQRPEINWTADLPGQLCDRIPEAVSVEVTRTQPSGMQRGMATC